MAGSLSVIAWILYHLGVDSTSKLNKPIHVASRIGDLYEVRKILSAGEGPAILGLFHHDVNLDAHDVQGYAPLHHAAKEGHLPIVKALLSYGANVNQLDSNGYSPLFLAIHNGHIGIAKFLLEAGAEKFSPDDVNFNRLLLLSARFGHIEKVKFCLDCGSKVNFTDSTGNSALTYALTLRGRLDIVRLLLDYGACPMIKLPSHKSLLHMVVEKGETEIADMLFQSHPYRPNDLVAPANNAAMQQLLANPSPFKIRSLKTLCWIAVGKDRNIEKEAHARGIPRFP